MLKILTPHNPSLDRNKEYLFTDEHKWHWFSIAYPNLDHKDYLKYAKSKECGHCGCEYSKENGKRFVKNKIICSDCDLKYY